ncbi:hypothetical protein MNBD_GAMMA02-449, partial [hydrothermal vent metagenome]
MDRVVHPKTLQSTLKLVYTCLKAALMALVLKAALMDLVDLVLKA